MTATNKFDSDDRQFSHIVGKPLRSVMSIEDGAALKFTMMDGTEYIYDAYGDCCSHSWIEHISVPIDVAGKSIGDITEPELPPHPAASPVTPEAYDDEIKVYHTAFHTPVGSIIVEYRNSSNGYYGGALMGPRK